MATEQSEKEPLGVMLKNFLSKCIKLTSKLRFFPNYMSGSFITYQSGSSSAKLHCKLTSLVITPLEKEKKQKALNL